MFLTEHPDARFMLISEGSYRALIPHKDDINVFRLTCSDKEPFYSLNGVVDKDSLILTAIKERAGNDSNLLIVFYVQIMPDDFVMQLHRF